MEEIKGWRPSKIESMLSEDADFLFEEEQVAQAIDTDLEQVQPFHNAIMEIKAEIDEIINNQES